MDDFPERLKEAQAARETLKREVLGEIKAIEEEGKQAARVSLEGFRGRLQSFAADSNAQLATITGNADYRKQMINQYLQQIGEMQKALRGAQAEQRKQKQDSQAEVASLRQKIREVKDKGAKAAADVGKLAKELRDEVQAEMEKQKRIFREAMDDANRTMVDIKARVR